MSATSKLVADAVPKRRPPNAGKGRKKGVPNKTTAAVKEALNAVYADLQANADKESGGGEHAHLMAWAQDNPTEFYKLWIKMLPQDVNASVAVDASEEAAALAALPREKREAVRAALRALFEART